MVPWRCQIRLLAQPTIYIKFMAIGGLGAAGLACTFFFLMFDRATTQDANLARQEASEITDYDLLAEETKAMDASKLTKDFDQKSLPFSKESHERARAILEKDALLKVEQGVAATQARATVFVAPFVFVLLLVGIALATSGFRLWYDRVQKFLDIQIEADTKAKLLEIKDK